MPGSTHPLAVQRLPSSVLRRVANRLTGVDAVNFGRVCKAWVEPAQLAIWRDINITLPHNYGETPDIKEKTSMRIADYLAFQAGIHMELDRQDDARTQAARCGRLREKIEGILAALYARPERIRAVRKITMSYETGSFGVTLLSVVRQSLQVLVIVKPGRTLETLDGMCPISPGLNIWPMFPGLLSSSATLDALEHMEVQLDETANDEELQALLLLTRNLRSLTVDIEGDLTTYLDTSDVRDQLDKVRSLSITCSPDVRYNKPPLTAASLVSACSNITQLTVLARDSEYDWLDLPEPWFHEDNRFMAAVGKLKHLKTLVAAESTLEILPSWKGPKRLERFQVRLEPGTWLSLPEGEFGEFIPKVPKLRELQLVASNLTETQLAALVKPFALVKPLNSFVCLSNVHVHSFDAAPLLSSIKVIYDPGNHRTPGGLYETLHITTLRQQGSTGPYLYWTSCAVRGPRDASTDKDASGQRMLPAGNGTRFKGRAIPLQVLQRMAEIEGVRAFRGRDIEVSSRAWAELEAYTARGGTGGGT